MKTICKTRAEILLPPKIIWFTNWLTVTSIHQPDQGSSSCWSTGKSWRWPERPCWGPWSCRWHWAGPCPRRRYLTPCSQPPFSVHRVWVPSQSLTRLGVCSAPHQYQRRPFSDNEVPMKNSSGSFSLAPRDVFPIVTNEGLSQCSLRPTQKPHYYIICAMIASWLPNDSYTNSDMYHFWK